MVFGLCDCIASSAVTHNSYLNRLKIDSIHRVFEPRAIACQYLFDERSHIWRNNESRSEQSNIVRDENFKHHSGMCDKQWINKQLSRKKCMPFIFFHIECQPPYRHSGTVYFHVQYCKLFLLFLWQVLNRTLETYGATEIFLSFNGGKDCTVLLDLVSKLFVEKYPKKRLLCLYIQPENPFEEIEEFIGECERLYKIEVKAIRGTVKAALAEICRQNPQLKACVMGCRRTDPYCQNLNEYQVRARSAYNCAFMPDTI